MLVIYRVQRIIVVIFNLMENCGDNVLKEHFKEAPRNATYRSETTQKNIIDVSAKFVTDNVVNEVKEVKYFPILADEGSDASVKEQLPLVIRFVDSELNIREESLGFIRCVEGTPLELQLLISFLDRSKHLDWI